MNQEETPQRDDSAPDPAAGAESSPEFGATLEAFERGGGAAPAAGEIATGARVRGTLLSIGDEYGIVDIGGRSEGVIEVRHLMDAKGSLKRGVGDVLDLFVVSTGDQVVLAPSLRPEASGAVRQLRESQKNGVPVSGRVVGKNPGGLAVDVSGVRGFCPVSQIETGFCADPSVYIGQTLDFLVTEVRGGRGGVVLSRRALLKRADDEKGKQLLASLKPGAEIEGTVARLEAFGAFVNLGGIDGLVHVSEIRHERLGHPSQALTVGDRVRVRVLRIEPGKQGVPRIALSIKAAQPDPWIDVEKRFTKGARVQGTVARLADFGAFVTVAPGLDGLVHVSESAPHPVAHVRDVLTPGQQVEAVVLAVDAAKKRLALSIRAAVAPETAAEPRPRPRQRSRPAEEPREKRAPAAAPQELTTMGIALRKALEKHREKNRDE